MREEFDPTLRASRTGDPAAGSRRAADDSDGAGEVPVLGDTMPSAARSRAAGEAGRVGRFVLLEWLGSGGMGVVWSAFDPELDRSIAVKLLHRSHSRDHSVARFLREAQAMARLSHPNVAQIYDVGVVDDQVFIAMELVAGRTLSKWLAEAPRSWREVLDVYVQAGRGLAAAHARGLVHRDFKPDNVLIGDDGRVRVADFGLAGEDDGSRAVRPPRMDAPVRAGHELLSASLTGASSWMGTPAYMSPEQHQRRPAGPASDQFSFCVALWEGLFGGPPFPRTTLAELSDAVTAGRVGEPPAASLVPRRIALLVRRGLAPRPEERHPDMTTLLRALERAAAPRGRTYLAGLGFACAAAVGGFMAAKAIDPIDVCELGAREIAEVWTDERREAAREAFVHAGPAFIAEVWPRVEADLDAYADAWEAAYRGACEARRGRTESDALAQRRLACLRQRKAAVGEAARLLAERDAAVSLRALELTHKLPAIAACVDVARLTDDAAPPDDPETARRVVAVEEALVRVKSLGDLGRHATARELADRLLVEAEGIDHPPLVARALLARAQLSLHDNDESFTRTIALLRRAAAVAVAARVDESAAEAMVHLLYLRGRSPGQAARELEDLELLAAHVARLPSPGPLRGLLLNNAAVVALARGEPAEARRLLAEALAVKRAAGVPRVELAYTRSNLAMLEEDPAVRSHEMRQVVEIFDEDLGAAHPTTIEGRMTASLYVREPEVARDLVRPGCEALARFSSGERHLLARCLALLAHHDREAGAVDEARVHAREAAALLLAGDGDTEQLRRVDIAGIRGAAALDDGEHAAAADELRRTLARVRRDAWWRHFDAAELELLLGEHLRALGDDAGAAAALQAAIDDLVAARTTTNGRQVRVDQLLARARVRLAALLLADPRPSPRDDARAGELLATASRWYTAAGEAYAWRLAELRALAATLAARSSP